MRTEGYRSLPTKNKDFFDEVGGRAWTAKRDVKKITGRACAYSSLLAATAEERTIQRASLP